MNLKALAAGLDTLLAPSLCLHCRRVVDAGRVLCRVCAGSLPVNRQPQCPVCGLQRREIGIKPCRRCKETDFKFDGNYSPLLFAGPVASLIHALKYGHILRAADTLAERMTDMLAKRGIARNHGIECITFVPLHRRKEREREFNQTVLLSGMIGEKIGLPLRPLLESIRYTASQTQRTSTQRMTATKGLFKALPGDMPERILLVDDVFTTGSTLSACAGVLKDAGARHVITITAAITPQSGNL